MKGLTFSETMAGPPIRMNMVSGAVRPPEDRMLDTVSQALQEAHQRLSTMDAGLAEIRNRLFGQVEAFEAEPDVVPEMAGKVADIRILAESLRERLEKLHAHLKHLNEL